jgi:hypothetical protein
VRRKLSVYLAGHSGRAWNAANKQLAGFCIVSQDGDSEGVLQLTHMSNANEVRTLRDYIGLRQDARRPARARAELAKTRLARPLTALHAVKLDGGQMEPPGRKERVPSL